MMDNTRNGVTVTDSDGVEWFFGADEFQAWEDWAEMEGGGLAY